MTDYEETVEQARDRLLPSTLAYAKCEGLSEVGIASAALRFGITDGRKSAYSAPTRSEILVGAESIVDILTMLGVDPQGKLEWDGPATAEVIASAVLNSLASPS